MAAYFQDYLLHLADNTLILGQRNAEWCGHGPVLEEDLALANNSLDLIGQARLLYQHVATVRKDGKSSEDLLAYFRDVPDFKNYTLLELPHSTALAPTSRGDRDYAVTIGRNFLYSALMVLVWEGLKGSADAQLAAIAAKSLKETQYHLRHAHDWLLRLGDGTDASHAKMQAAITHLMPYTQEFFTPSAMETAVVKSGQGVDTRPLQASWNAIVDDALAAATLKRPAAGGFVTTGKTGVHSEHLGFVLAEMQSLARAHPEAVW
ncbi:MAG: 1,2-phenylacetyl-CoA epoxidase subunit PaaC [Rhodoferax sp.]|uniref:1,2-phenylacetyl-CoA epoxidase subunit PaaC n=1 Tax=Rhodoferax sp. TaxID=50421 RepID=UPI0008AB78F8|nr:1,2-phenylacetyl-CoA epoxidase subunit PaaC [Rhodoferax sp.]MDP2680374.1 1,2-phenylacetyl-CoA epoxidase subunit PaaC [Rhodoferax sp.]OGB50655.1 MAG: phenylacetate-CoA oxygenase subunit PaaI [Burkholderiales bacterium RIFOXYD12_FULL_59_19]OGB82867.1 MAG: phenylacetate-CoA oxygenase subunit PaaI [Burkholderiales bacterium RIFOXYC12_FULL_60_6]